MVLTNLETIPEVGVSHNFNVTKKVLISKGIIPGVTQLAKTVVPPGEVCGSHFHKDMWEIFLVDEGCGVMVVNEKEIKLKKGDCMIIEPYENHELINNSINPLKLMVFGCIGSS